MALPRLVTTLTKGNLWLYVLKMLSEKSTYPLDLKRQFAERFQFSPATITFYVVLYKLRREGLVEVVNGDLHKIYRCTPAGLETLRKGIDFIEKVSLALQE